MTAGASNEAPSGGLPPAEPGGVTSDVRGQRGDDSGSTSDGSGLARGARGLPTVVDTAGGLSRDSGAPAWASSSSTGLSLCRRRRRFPAPRRSTASTSTSGSFPLTSTVDRNLQFSTSCSVFHQLFDLPSHTSIYQYLFHIDVWIVLMPAAERRLDATHQRRSPDDSHHPPASSTRHVCHVLDDLRVAAVRGVVLSRTARLSAT